MVWLFHDNETYSILFSSSLQNVKCHCSTGRGIRRTVKGFGLQEEELEEMNPDDLEAMTDASYDTFNQKAAHIEM